MDIVTEHTTDVVPMFTTSTILVLSGSVISDETVHMEAGSQISMLDTWSRRNLYTGIKLEILGSIVFASTYTNKL